MPSERRVSLFVERYESCLLSFDGGINTIALDSQFGSGFVTSEEETRQVRRIVFEGLSRRFHVDIVTYHLSMRYYFIPVLLRHIFPHKRFQFSHRQTPFSQYLYFTFD
jgi:hypothetical protein